MANNPYVNKVQKADGTTIMDISGDDVTPSDVLSGVLFHDRSGAAQTGSLITHNVYDGLDSDSTSDALSAKQGKWLNDNKPKKITKTISANGSVTIGSSELPSAYVVATTGSNSASLTFGIGAGYGATGARHKLQIIQSGSNITYTVSDSEYGLTIASTANVTVHILEI